MTKKEKIVRRSIMDTDERNAKTDELLDSIEAAELNEWTQKIAEADSRPYYPEDYIKYAKQLLAMPNPTESFARIMANRENTKIHTDMWYSFLDWFQYEIEGLNHIPGAKTPY